MIQKHHVNFPPRTPNNHLHLRRGGNRRRNLQFPSQIFNQFTGGRQRAVTPDAVNQTLTHAINRNRRRIPQKRIAASPMRQRFGSGGAESLNKRFHRNIPPARQPRRAASRSPPASSSPQLPPRSVSPATPAAFARRYDNSHPSIPPAHPKPAFHPIEHIAPTSSRATASLSSDAAKPKPGNPPAKNPPKHNQPAHAPWTTAAASEHAPPAPAFV